MYKRPNCSNLDLTTSTPKYSICLVCPKTSKIRPNMSKKSNYIKICQNISKFSFCPKLNNIVTFRTSRRSSWSKRNNYNKTCFLFNVINQICARCNNNSSYTYMLDKYRNFFMILQLISI